MYATTTATQPRNTYALVSFLCGLGYAILLLIEIVVVLLENALRASVTSAVTSGSAVGNQLFLSTALSFLSAAISVVALPCLILAIVMGHLALGWAKSHPAAPPWRGLAITGLTLGYIGGALAIIGVIALAIVFAFSVHF
jgi:hypothetical protein